MSRKKGDEAEAKALLYLKNLNYQIVEQNFYAKKLGEIDIIAKKNDIYHFVEVKSAKDYETAVNNLSNQKLFKIKKSLEYYLQKNKLNVAFCIDAIIIYENNIEFLENITL